MSDNERSRAFSFYDDNSFLRQIVFADDVRSPSPTPTSQLDSLRASILSDSDKPGETSERVAQLREAADRGAQKDRDREENKKQENLGTDDDDNGVVVEQFSPTMNQIADGDWSGDGVVRTPLFLKYELEGEGGGFGKSAAAPGENDGFAEWMISLSKCNLQFQYDRIDRLRIQTDHISFANNNANSGSSTSVAWAKIVADEISNLELTEFDSGVNLGVRLGAKSLTLPKMFKNDGETNLNTQFDIYLKRTREGEEGGELFKSQIARSHTTLKQLTSALTFFYTHERFFD